MLQRFSAVDRWHRRRNVLAYMRAYIAERTDWRKPENYKQAVDHLEAFLRRDIPLTTVTKGDMERWHRWMHDDPKGPKLSPNTSGQNVKRVRQIMAQAIDDQLITSNPFSGIKIDLRSDKTKNRFIDEHQAVAILDACPDQERRVLFALSRYGGLRCPSESLRLRWSDIQWERERFKVTAPKTARYGKGERIVPLWPQLLAELSELFGIVKPGVDCPADAFVIQRYRDTEGNLRTTFAKIVGRAGVPSFPKPFMALRASRRTELERTGRFANHVLNDWFGHSGAIAEPHYLQTTEADFTEASSEGPRGNFEGQPLSDVEQRETAEGQSLGQRKSPTATKDSEKARKNPHLTTGDGVRCGYVYTPEDSNL
ncbi:tyrosine-type recombinase/integrase [Planctomycetaceae bacterium SH139]